MSWFNWYSKQIDKQKPWAKFRDRYLCPCCGMPTLGERAKYEICSLCFWEDDGQDSDDAADIRGGPNHDYSLSEARLNFIQHLTMYRPTDSEHFQRELSRLDLKKASYHAFQKAIESNDMSDWSSALLAEKYLDDRA